jgi:catechol 2,3-dioxygenase-like lactoylglutathione lyase family enzyme
VDLFLVEVRVRDAPAAWAWFRDVLGLRLGLVDASNGFALLDAGGVNLAVKRGREAPGEAFSLVFRVDDLLAERQRLAALGVPVGQIVENASEGYRELRLVGPEGLVVRLFAWTRPR